MLIKTNTQIIEDKSPDLFKKKFKCCNYVESIININYIIIIQWI